LSPANRARCAARYDSRMASILLHSHALALLLAGLGLCATPPTTPDVTTLLSAPATSRFVYPFAHRGHPPACPPVEVDTTSFAQGAEWGVLAKGLVESWYPRIAELLATDGLDPLDGKPHGKPFATPRAIKIVIAKTLDAPAYTTGNEIHVNGSWIVAHPDDSGLLIHELAHVLQAYPGGPKFPGWLSEGIADYVRWWRYEPELAAGAGRTRIDPAKSKYTDSYRVTAMWLAWCSRAHDMRLVPALDLALRNGEDPLPLFEKLCGKDAEALWKEFVAEQG